MEDGGSSARGAADQAARRIDQAMVGGASPDATRGGDDPWASPMPESPFSCRIMLVGLGQQEGWDGGGGDSANPLHPEEREAQDSVGTRALARPIFHALHPVIAGDAP